MKVVLSLALLTGLAALSTAQLFNSSLAVISIGDGVTAPSGSGSPVNLVNFRRTGASQTPLLTRALPLVMGDGVGEGALVSNYGNQFAIAGYSANYYPAPLFASSAAEVPRRIVSLNALYGQQTITDLAADDFSAGTINSAQATPDGRLWAAGTKGYGNGPATSPTSDLAFTPTSADVRVLQRIGGSSYYTTANDFFAATSGAGTSMFGTNAPGFSNAYDFQFVGLGLYIADADQGLMRAAYDTTTGLYGTAVRVGNLPGIRQLASDGTTFWATTTETTNNRLISFNLTGGNLVTIASAGTNKVFRGVETVPVPEPASMAILGLGALALLRRRKSA